jgi:predicted glycoside hydrolase/deacetylase ChbG (UPF0249 family)
MTPSTRLLGYPDDARLLIINADDLGMCHSINEAIFRSLKEGVVQSTSLMVPCPWALHAMNWLRENPDISFSVHLTLICDTKNYAWGPLAPKHSVPSLVDESGRYFYSLERMDEFLAQANADEVELEFRAQLETVLAAGLKPTHLDWHCLRNGGRDDIFEMTFRLAQEHGLAVRVYGEPWIEDLQSRGFPTNDHYLLDSFSMDGTNKTARYLQLLRDLPEGLNEWAVHPGLATPEMIAIKTGGAEVRQPDFDFVMSPEARAVIEQEGIILLGYRPMQAAWQRTF